MAEIILSFFAVIGIALLAIRFFDTIFYRKMETDIDLIVNLSKKSEEEIIALFELLSTVRSSKSGKAATGRIFYLCNEKSSLKQDVIYHYDKIFNLNGTVIKKEDPIPYSVFKE